MPNSLLLRFITFLLFSFTFSCSEQTNNDITIIKNSALELINKNSKIEVLGDSFKVSEGPLWDSILPLPLIQNHLVLQWF